MVVSVGRGSCEPLIHQDPRSHADLGGGGSMVCVGIFTSTLFRGICHPSW